MGRTGTRRIVDVRDESAEEAAQMEDNSITSDLIKKVDKHEPDWNDDAGFGGAAAI